MFLSLYLSSSLLLSFCWSGHVFSSLWSNVSKAKNLILLNFWSPLLSKTYLISEQFILLWRALSNPSVPCQALTKMWWNTNYKCFKRWKWFHWSHISSKIPAASSHLTPFHSHFLPGWKLVHGREDDRQSTAHELIVKMKKCWHFGGKISIPPHTSVPPGLRLPGFHLPSSSPCHQEVAGRGYLLPRSQWYDIWYNII